MCILRAVAHSVGLVTAVEVLSDFLELAGVDCSKNQYLFLYAGRLAGVPVPLLKRVIYNKYPFISEVAELPIKLLTKDRERV